MINRLTAALALLALLAQHAAADEPKKASPLAFGIAAIDAQAQTAELKTRGGTGHLRIVQAVNAMHFLEVVREGFLHITTIYDKDEGKGAYPAVHSRHFGLFGQPLVTQYQGFCEATG